ncbi:ROK family protein, partial [Streptomyces albidoflavus]|nr:ROK family protein [Streptomyces albidoflavus]
MVGLDLGGTKIAAALVAPDGTVLTRRTDPTPATR